MNGKLRFEMDWSEENQPPRITFGEDVLDQLDFNPAWTPAVVALVASTLVGELVSRIAPEGKQDALLVESLKVLRESCDDLLRRASS